MLRFYRHIRKKLMERNKVRTYIVYAMGEILLVVIGILIAVQLDDWNQERLNAEKEQIILQNLRNDLNVERSNLIRHIDMQRTWVRDGVYILKHYDDNAGFIVDTGLVKRINDLFVRAGYGPVITTFETLENTGNLDLIQNESLKSEIVNYYQSIIGFGRNTQNNNSDLVDGLVNNSLIDNTVFLSYLFTDETKDWFAVVDQVDYELKSVQPLLHHLQTKLSDIEHASRIINVVNFRIMLANVQLYYAELYVERTDALLSLIYSEIGD